MKTRKEQRKEDNIYTEVHHILPRCLGGTDDPDNLVILTYREHYLAHWLLTKIHKNCDKVLWAFSLMDGKLSPLSKREVTSKQFDRCRKALVEAARLRCLSDNPMHCPKARKKLSSRMKGKNNPTVKYPHKNRTAYPVRVVFENGTFKDYECGKYAQTDLNVPLVTWKYWIKNNKGSKKYGISYIIKLSKKEKQKT